MKRCFVLLMILGLCVTTVCAADVWANPDLGKRVMITVNNDPSILGYQAFFDFPYSESMQGDFDDVRFYSVSGELLKSYIISYNFGINAKCFVSLPSDCGYIYLYYSNATYGQNNDATMFEFFDHFDDAVPSATKWRYEFNGYAGSVSDSFYHLVVVGDYTKGIISQMGFNQNYRVITSAEFKGGFRAGIGFKEYGDYLNHATLDYEGWYDYNDYYMSSRLGDTCRSITQQTNSYTGLHIWETDRSVSNARFFMDGTEYYHIDHLQDPTCNLPISICGNGYGEDAVIDVDWIVVCKTVDIIPSFIFGVSENIPTDTPQPELPRATLQARPIASATIAPLDDTGYYLLNTALGLNEQYNESAGTGQLDPRGVFNASTYPFTGGEYGDYASLLIFAVPFLLAWMRQNSAIIPMSFGCILGTWMLWQLPAEWQMPATGLIILSMMGILYGIYKEKY